MRLAFVSDWYVQLLSPDRRGPRVRAASFRRPAAGVLVTIEAEEVDAVDERARLALRAAL